MTNKPYYPNNFDAIAAADDELFEPCTYEEFVDWRLSMWQIPSSIYCIIRAEHKDTGKITEHIYQQPGAAHKRLLKYVQAGTHKLVVADHDAISIVQKPPESGAD